MTRHQKILELLPWFVNGTLDEQERSMVNEHLNSCGTCHDEFMALKETSEVFHATTEPSKDSIVHARYDFMQQLEGKSRKVGPASRWMIPVSLAACLLIAILLFGPFSQQEQSFETLGANASSKPVIQLIFQPDTAESFIQSLVTGDQRHIISGPTAQGVYRIELLADEDPQQVLQSLKDHPNVIFAALEVNP